MKYWDIKNAVTKPVPKNYSVHVTVEQDDPRYFYPDSMEPEVAKRDRYKREVFIERAEGVPDIFNPPCVSMSTGWTNPWPKKN